METYKNRQFFLSLASHLERSKNPNGYIKRKKIVVTPLLTEYREALRETLGASCLAKAESLADEKVSAAHNWPTLETLRRESLEAFKRQNGL